jgi:hypothetical protein
MVLKQIVYIFPIILENNLDFGNRSYSDNRKDRRYRNRLWLNMRSNIYLLLVVRVLLI